MVTLKPIKMSNGVDIPLVGYGTWLSTDTDKLKASLRVALDNGYRYIDTASLYQNEHIIGELLQEYYDSGKLKRSDLFITTKLPLYGHQQVDHFVKASLKGLHTDYIDLYLIHTPTPLQVDANGDLLKDKDGELVPDVSIPLIDTWHQLEEYYKKGVFKAIGLSNFSAAQITDVYNKAEIKPHNLQIELQIFFPQNELIELCRKLNISVTSYGSLGSPDSYNIRGVQSDCLNHPLVVEMAKRYRKTPAQILLRYVLQRGANVIPKSLTESRIIENFKVLDFELTAADMKRFETEVREHVRLFPFQTLKYHPWFPFDDTKSKQ